MPNDTQVTFAVLSRLARAAGLSQLADAVDAEATKPNDHFEGQDSRPCSYCNGSLKERACVQANPRPGMTQTQLDQIGAMK